MTDETNVRKYLVLDTACYIPDLAASFSACIGLSWRSMMAEKQCPQCGHYVYEHDEKGRCWCDKNSIHVTALEIKDEHDPHEEKARQRYLIKQLGY